MLAKLLWHYSWFGVVLRWRRDDSCIVSIACISNLDLDIVSIAVWSPLPSFSTPTHALFGFKLNVFVWSELVLIELAQKVTLFGHLFQYKLFAQTWKVVVHSRGKLNPCVSNTKVLGIYIQTLFKDTVLRLLNSKYCLFSSSFLWKLWYLNEFSVDF